MPFELIILVLERYVAFLKFCDISITFSLFYLLAIVFPCLFELVPLHVLY